MPTTRKLLSLILLALWVSAPLLAQQTVLTLYFLRTPDGAGGYTVEQVEGLPAGDNASTVVDPIHITCLSSVTDKVWDVFEIVQTPAGDLEANKTTVTPNGQRSFAVDTPTPPGGGTPENPWVFAGLALQLNNGAVAHIAGASDPRTAADMAQEAIGLGWPQSESCATVRLRSLWFREYDRSGESTPAWSVATFVGNVPVRVSVAMVD